MEEVKKHLKQILGIADKNCTVIIVGIGNIAKAIAEYKGATDKAELAATLQKASSGSCAGGSCGPGGCPPK